MSLGTTALREGLMLVAEETLLFVDLDRSVAIAYSVGAYDFFLFSFCLRRSPTMSSPRQNKVFYPV